MNIKNLERCFFEASKQDKKYVGVKIKMEGFPKAEIIINENNNFDKKFEYYKNAYNEDLTLKTFTGIKIVGFTYGDSFNEIEEDLIGQKKENVKKSDLTLTIDCSQVKDELESIEKHIDSIIEKQEKILKFNKSN